MEDLKVEFLKFLLNGSTEIVKRAGKMLIDTKSIGLSISEKGFANFVTSSDLLVQEYISKELIELFPMSSILSEESESFKEGEKYVWVLDPIDGTTNFIHSYPNYTISLALTCLGESIIGVVYNPVTDELFSAIGGLGATLNGVSIKTSSAKTLSKSIVGFGLPYDRSRSELIFRMCEGVYSKCQDLKRSGPASLDMCYVACGRLDAYFELDLKPWDIAAGRLIIEEAGGMSSVYWEGCLIVVSNGVLTDELATKLLEAYV